MKITREIKAAFIVILGIVVFIIGFSFLKGMNIFDSYNTYYTEFDYNALKQASPVTIKGNPVGKITDIKYDFKTGKTRVAFTVDHQLKFSKSSKVRMYDLGLLDGKGLALIIIEDDAPIAKNGDVLLSEVEEGLVNTLTSNFSGLSTGLDSTLKKADTLLTSLNIILRDESEKGLKHAVEELNRTLKSFRELSASANKLIAQNTDSVAALINNFNDVSNDLSGLTNDLKEIKLSETVAKLDEALVNANNLLGQLNNNEGTVGKLLNDDQLYVNLEGVTKELEELIRDIKLHPNRYTRILSKKEIPYEENKN